MITKFGSYIRERRISAGLGQRELAKKIGIAASYLNDIEIYDKDLSATYDNAFITYKRGYQNADPFWNSLFDSRKTEK